jgi:predicted RNase H-like HicB family nuclease
MFPTCPVSVSAPRHLDEAKDLIREAIEFYLEGVRQHGDGTPVPSAIAEYNTV